MGTIDSPHAALARARADLEAAHDSAKETLASYLAAHAHAAATIDHAAATEEARAVAAIEARAAEEIDRREAAAARTAAEWVATEKRWAAEDDAAAESHRRSLANACAELAAATEAAAPGTASADWDDPDAWALPTWGVAVPAMARAGVVETPVGPVPALVPLTTDPLFLTGPRADPVLVGILTRALAASPPGRLVLHVFDPIDLGRSLGGLLALADRPGPLGTRLHTTPSTFGAALADITTIAEDVVRRHLRGEHADLAAYNATATRPLPNHLIVAFGLSDRWPEPALDSLAALVAAGPASGVNVIATIDKAAPTRHDFARGVTLRCDDHALSAHLASIDTTITLDRPVPDHIVASVCTNATTADAPAGPGLADIVIGGWWDATSDKGVDLPVGWAGDAPATLHLGDRPAHGLLVGRTGSGKSTLLHTLIHATCARYSPDEVQLWLVDLKEGVEFARYGLDPVLPHLRVVASDADREFALAVLATLRGEAERRGAAFRTAPGGSVASLASYRGATGEILPRVVLIMDEFHLLLAGDDHVAQAAWDHLDYLVREGRSFGVHLLLASQSLGGLGSAAIGRYRLLFDQMALRVALRSSDEDSRLALGDDAATKLDGLGACVVNTEAGFGSHQSLTIAYADAETQAAFRSEIAAQAAGRSWQAPVVFCGSDGVAFPGPPATQNVAWVGSPVDLGGDVEVAFGAEPGRHLAVVGRHADEALAVIDAVVRSLACPGARTVVADLSEPGGAAAAALAALAAEVGAHHAQGPDGLAAVLHALPYDGVPTFVVGFGLHRSRLRAAGPGVTASPGADLLARLLADGPMARCHLIGWWDGLASLTATCGRSWSDLLGVRVGVGVAPDDQRPVFGSTFTVRRRRAVLVDADRPGELIRFIPYRGEEA